MDGEGIEEKDEQEVAERAEEKPEGRHEQETGIVENAEDEDHTESGEEEAVELEEKDPGDAAEQVGLGEDEEQDEHPGEDQPDEHFLAQPDLAEGGGLEAEVIEDGVGDGGGNEHDDEEVRNVAKEGEPLGDEEKGDNGEDEAELGGTGELAEGGDEKYGAAGGLETGKYADGNPSGNGESGPAGEDGSDAGVRFHDGDGIEDAAEREEESESDAGPDADRRNRKSPHAAVGINGIATAGTPGLGGWRGRRRTVHSDR
jgi:hypothetical protein